MASKRKHSQALWAALATLALAGCSEIIGLDPLHDETPDGSTQADGGVDGTTPDTGVDSGTDTSTSNDVTTPDTGADVTVVDVVTQDVVTSDVNTHHDVVSSDAPSDVNTTDSATDAGCAETVCGGRCVNLQTSGTDCGRCTHSCLAGGTCSGGKCQPITFVPANLVGAINSIASDGNVVVWADDQNNEIDEVTSAGATSKIGLAIPPVVTNSPFSVAISADGTTVAWTEYDGVSTSHWGLASAGTAASGKIEPLDGGGFGGVMSGLTAGAWGGTAAVMTLLHTSTTSFQLLSCGLTSLNCTGLKTVAGQSGFNVASDSTYAVFSDGASQIIQYNTSTAATTPITGQNTALWVADDGKYVYWSPGGSSVYPILRAALGTTTVKTVVADVGGPVGTLATDGVNVYFLSDQTGEIYYVPVGGGTPALLTSKAASHMIYAGGAVFFDAKGVIYQIATP
jgi:hypothetical protein